MATVEDLLARLEERFILGEITEKTYRDLLAKIQLRGASVPGAVAASPTGGTIQDSVIKGDVSSTSGAASVGNINVHMGGSSRHADAELEYEFSLLMILRAGGTMEQASADLDHRRQSLGLSLRLAKEIERACVEEHTKRMSKHEHSASFSKAACSFTCPSCGAGGRASSTVSGKQMKCPKCGIRIRVSENGECFALEPVLSVLKGKWRGNYSQAATVFPFEVTVEEQWGCNIQGVGREPTPFWAREQGYVGSQLSSEIVGSVDESGNFEFTKFYTEFGYGVAYQGHVRSSGADFTIEGAWSIGDQSGPFKLTLIKSSV